MMSCYTDILRQEEEEEKSVTNCSQRTIKMKMDTAWKSLLRGIRLCLRGSMDASLMFVGRNYWEDSKLFGMTRRLL